MSKIYSLTGCKGFSYKICQFLHNCQMGREKLREVSQNILILPEPGGVTRLIRCDSVTRNTLHVGTLAGLVCDQRELVT